MLVKYMIDFIHVVMVFIIYRIEIDLVPVQKKIHIKQKK
jgi:hypothetical protein